MAFVRKFIGALIGLAVAVTAQAAVNADQLQKCYQEYGQVEQTQQASAAGSKKVAVYRSQGEVAADCNATALKSAQAEKNPAAILSLARIVGINSNWGAAAPLFNVAAMKDPKRDVCVHDDINAVLDQGLPHPATSAAVKDVTALMATCWPRIAPLVSAVLAAPDLNTYARNNVCDFLKGKGALTGPHAAICRT